MSDTDRKAAILETLARFIASRPGLEWANYGDSTSYRADQRAIARDRRHAETLMAYVGRRPSITADDLMRAARDAYSGRLTITESPEGFRIDYCTGQYYPTEYRRATCAVLASAIWDNLRANMPEGIRFRNMETGEQYTLHNGLRAGDYLRQAARHELGSPIASRFFN